jgi:3-methyladenine DNA glycosylase Tag
MGVYFEKALSRFEKQKAEALAKDEARKRALLLKNARALRRIGKVTKQEQAATRAKLLAEQPERLDAYVAAVAEWCNTPRRRRNRTPSPSIRDFGILNELKAISYLFRTITIEY